MHIRTVIIGSGFAGRTVADALDDDDYMIVERGQPYDHTIMAETAQTQRPFDHKIWVNARDASEPKTALNQLYCLAPNLRSQFEFVGGGTSNRWDGNALRINRLVVDATGPHAWPLKFDDLVPFYNRAEEKMNLHGDTIRFDGSSPKTTRSDGDHYRDLLGPEFRQAFITNTAKNPIKGLANQGVCVGAGTCQLCPVDAKLRPDHVFPGQNIAYGKLATKINFDGAKAVSVDCTGAEGDTRITFDRLVVAAHAIESSALIWRSDLPSATSNLPIGRYFQDHAVASILVRHKEPLAKRRALSINSGPALVDLNGFHNGLEYLVSLTDAEHEIRSQSDAFLPLILKSLGRQVTPSRFLAELGHLSVVKVLFETPWDLGLEVIFSGEFPRINMENYPRIFPTYDAVITKLKKQLSDRGLNPLGALRSYRHIMGTHHLMGTLNFSSGKNAVVGPDFKLLGTDNVYVSGSALFPRSGATHPTLTIFALGLMLGEQLKH